MGHRTSETVDSDASARPISKEQARALIDELLDARTEAARYGEVVAELRRVLGTLEPR